MRYRWLLAVSFLAVLTGCGKDVGVYNDSDYRHDRSEQVNSRRI